MSAYDIKEHYKEHDIEFTDSEKATLIWNSLLPFNEKLEALQEILDSTADEVLKEQIEKRLEIERETERAFMVRDSDYVHGVILDDAKNSDSVFASIDAAILYGRENCEETFKISKVILEDKLESDTEERVLLGGEAKFKKDGVMIYCACYHSKEIERRR